MLDAMSVLVATELASWRYARCGSRPNASRRRRAGGFDAAALVLPAGIEDRAFGRTSSRADRGPKFRRRESSWLI